mgnify:CR=1 FL=1
MTSRAIGGTSFGSSAFQEEGILLCCTHGQCKINRTLVKRMNSFFCKSCNTPSIHHVHTHPHSFRVFQEVQAALNLWEPKKLMEYQCQMEHLECRPVGSVVCTHYSTSHHPTLHTSTSVASHTSITGLQWLHFYFSLPLLKGAPGSPGTAEKK